jgi:hypothetical protein
MPEWVASLFQTIFGSLLYDLLLAAGVAALLGWLKSKASQWANPVLYGIVAFTAVLIIGYVLTGRPVLSKQQPQVTPENIEANVKTWSENLGMSVERTNRQDAFFSYAMRLYSGDPVLQFMSTISIAPEHQAILAKLSQVQSEKMIQELNLEVARANLGCSFGISGTQNATSGTRFLTAVFLQRGVPLENLNEGYFGVNFDEITRGVELVRAVILLKAQSLKQS